MRGDDRNLTVEQVVDSTPELSKFDLLVYNAGARDLLAGTDIQLYAPANNYMDYLPKGYVASLTQAQARSLVRAHLGASPPPNARIFREYQAQNGAVYVTDQVLAP